MMEPVSVMRLDVIGIPRLLIGDQRPSPGSKPLVLLGYLVLERRPVARDEIVALLWPDLDRSRGRATLRTRLSSLKATLGSDVIEASEGFLSVTPPRTSRPTCSTSNASRTATRRQRPLYPGLHSTPSSFSWPVWAAVSSKASGSAARSSSTTGSPAFRAGSTSFATRLASS